VFIVYRFSQQLRSWMLVDASLIAESIVE